MTNEEKTARIKQLNAEVSRAVIDSATIEPAMKAIALRSVRRHITAEQTETNPARRPFTRLFPEVGAAR